MAAGHSARIAKRARLTRRQSIDDIDIVTSLSQCEGGRDADYSCTNDRNSGWSRAKCIHPLTLCRGRGVQDLVEKVKRDERYDEERKRITTCSKSKAQQG